MKRRKKVFICSPLRGNVEHNMDKARKYCRNALISGVIPIAPHIYFTQFLNEEDEKERDFGIECGMELLCLCDEVWVYKENGVSNGMRREINCAEKNGIKIVYK